MPLLAYSFSNKRGRMEGAGGIQKRFLQYLRSAQLYGNQSISGKLRMRIRKRVLAIFTTYMDNRFK